jgi:hypothetical protein
LAKQEYTSALILLKYYNLKFKFDASEFLQHKFKCEGSNKFLLQELAYIISSISKSKTLQEGDEHTNQQRRNDPLKVMNAAEKNEINWTPN